MITPRTPHKGISRIASAMILATSLGLSTFGTAAAQTDSPADNPVQAETSAGSGSLSGSAADGSAEGSIGSLDGTRAASKVMNDPTCHPAPEHPRPVVFLHGTSENIGAFVALAKELKAEGYCTWGETYGKGGGSAQGMVPFLGGVTDINVSAERESEFIQQVLDTTGADKVDLVGHSQGGLLTKLIIEKLGHADQVDRVVTMGASFHGTDYNGMGKGLRNWINATPRLAEWILSEAAAQQIVGSPFLEEINKLPDTHSGITYTSLYSPVDTTVTPNSSSQLEQVEGADVANVDTGAVCSDSGKVNHNFMAFNKTYMALTKWELERPSGETTPSPGTVCH